MVSHPEYNRPIARALHQCFMESAVHHHAELPLRAVKPA